MHSIENREFTEAEYLLQRSHPSYNRLSISLQSLQQLNQDFAEALNKTNGDIFERLLLIIVILNVFAVICAITIGVFMGRSIGIPS